MAWTVGGVLTSRFLPTAVLPPNSWISSPSWLSQISRFIKYSNAFLDDINRINDSERRRSAVLPVLERLDAVIDELRGTAPYSDVTAFEGKATHQIGAVLAGPQEYRRQAERDEDDWSIPLVAVPTDAASGEFSGASA